MATTNKGIIIAASSFFLFLFWLIPCVLVPREGEPFGGNSLISSANDTEMRSKIIKINVLQVSAVVLKLSSRGD